MTKLESSNQVRMKKFECGNEDSEGNECWSFTRWANRAVIAEIGGISFRDPVPVSTFELRHSSFVIRASFEDSSFVIRASARVHSFIRHSGFDF